MFNLRTVIKFEVFRALKKPTFWIATFSVPIFFSAFFLISRWSSSFSEKKIEELSKETFSYEVIDQSGVLLSEVVAESGGIFSQNKENSIEKVKNGEISAFFDIPENLNEGTIQIFGNYEDFRETDKYSFVINNLIKMSALQKTDHNVQAAFSNHLNSNITTFKDGKEYNPLSEMIIPGLFLVIFYLISTFLSNRMIVSTTEEKENRVTEMILTSISAKTLILGKIISILFLGFVQILALLLPIILGFVFFRENLNLPNIANIAGEITVDPVRITLGVLLLIFGFFSMTGFIVALGAIMPTAQEASNYFAFIILLLMAPFFIFPAFISSETNPAVEFMTYFPLTAPISLLLRNTLGTISPLQALIGVFCLAIFSTLAILTAVRLFQFGTLSYDSKISLKSIFSKKS